MINVAYDLGDMRRLPPLPAIRVFEAAARHGNFTRAAAELGMTQAAVSYQIRLLEERLGVALFHRSRQRVTLTDAGRRAAPLITGAFDTIADAFAALSAENDSVLSISTTTTFATNWLAPRLGAFQLSRPELAVRIDVVDRLIDFATSDIDVAIRGGRGDWPGLVTHLLFSFPFTPICTPEFRDRHRIAEPADLLRVPRLSPGDALWRRWFKAAGLEEPDARPGLFIDAQSLEGAAVLAGHGVAMMSPVFWPAELASGRLVRLFPIMGEDPPAYWLVYPEPRRNQPKIKAFREWLLAELAPAGR